MRKKEIVPWLPEYQLGHEVMDNIHQEFIALLNELLAKRGQAFYDDFSLLIRHTKEHFAFEEIEMEKLQLASRHEHRGEHQRILSEMDFFFTKAKNGRCSFARAYLKEQLPHWLRQHTATMDADLASKLGPNGFSRQAGAL